jgi:hypothetical protein
MGAEGRDQRRKRGRVACDLFQRRKLGGERRRAGQRLAKLADGEGQRVGMARRGGGLARLFQAFLERCDPALKPGHERGSLFRLLDAPAIALRRGGGRLAARLAGGLERGLHLRQPVDQRGDGGTAAGLLRRRVLQRGDLGLGGGEPRSQCRRRGGLPLDRGEARRGLRIAARILGKRRRGLAARPPDRRKLGGHRRSGPAGGAGEAGAHRFREPVAPLGQREVGGTEPGENDDERPGDARGSAAPPRRRRRRRGRQEFRQRLGRFRLGRSGFSGLRLGRLRLGRRRRRLCGSALFRRFAHRHPSFFVFGRTGRRFGHRCWNRFRFRRGFRFRFRFRFRLGFRFGPRLRARRHRVHPAAKRRLRRRNRRHRRSPVPARRGGAALQTGPRPKGRRRTTGVLRVFPRFNRRLNRFVAGRGLGPGRRYCHRFRRRRRRSRG